MNVTIPVVVLLGILVVLGVRFLKLRLWSVLLCVAFGFLLAATAVAPDIRRALGAFLSWITGS
ncbi:hypothetical protein [Nonomuraea sp. NEAU-A123]|uniref:hypothetical protein n=1 Tax=Nonomuraea sp. NEAU-A123 TaxID=2839649 RepID=UPI001BE3DC14|nr:hypothetical protein [Nonomuraea sp. NEAU-A123]MBT2225991.1 hypothetical protein [Nonomuraea sp. NEAU-A123]